MAEHYWWIVFFKIDELKVKVTIWINKGVDKYFLENCLEVYKSIISIVE